MRCSVVFGVTLRLLVINISSCLLLSTPPLTTSDKCLNLRDMVRRRRIDNTWPVAALTARGQARYRLRIAIYAHPPAFDAPLGGFPSEYCHAVWCGKLEWLGYPMVKKVSKISLFILTECTNVTDRHTDRHTHTT